VHAATVLARRLAEREQPGAIVTFLCDNADKYLSERFWNEP
jgi:cysteine synthase